MTKTPTEEAVERLKADLAGAGSFGTVFSYTGDLRILLSELSRLQAERDHWRAIAEDRLASANALLDRARAAEAERDRAVEALTEARDLLLERIHGSPARSAAHNARVRIESALASLTLPPPVKEAEPVNEVIVTPGDLQDLLIAAYEQGAHDTHEHYQPDPDPSFKEAAWDYVASLDFTATTRPHRATPPALQARVEALEKSTGAQADIRGGKIEISIDIDALPIIVSGSCAAADVMQGLWKVTDAEVFAKEVCHALNDENEIGTTPVHVMFDKAFMHAIEQGAEGIEEASEEDFEAESARLSAALTGEKEGEADGR